MLDFLSSARTMLAIGCNQETSGNDEDTKKPDQKSGDITEISKKLGHFTLLIDIV